MQMRNIKIQMRFIQCMYQTHFVSGLSGFLKYKYCDIWRHTPIQLQFYSGDKGTRTPDP
jgi:hypothetical protein